jgi:7-cyano-7-deazaguanine synthase
MKQIVLFSGGLDSTTLLWFVRGVYDNVKALSFDYGQRHGKELMHAAAICDKYEIERAVVNLSAVNKFISKGSQAGRDPVPEGHYAEESMKQTIVPNRNMIMLSIAVGHAVALGGGQVWYAAHEGDHAIYPDCRPEFVRALDEAIHIGNDWDHAYLRAPFIHMSKTEIVRLGTELGVPFHMTWSCYKGLEYSCGVCGTCVERLEAFARAGIKDPLTYA